MNKYKTGDLININNSIFIIVRVSLQSQYSMRCINRLLYIDREYDSYLNFDKRKIYKMKYD